MPFKSKAQWRYFFAAATNRLKGGKKPKITLEMAKRWVKETPVAFKNLPARVRAHALKRALFGKRK